MNALEQSSALLFRHRALILQSVKTEYRYRTAGTSFGIVWLLLTPILLLSVYSVVYAVIFRIRPSGMTELQYVAYLFCGLVPFLAMSEAIVAGISSLSAHSSLLSSTVFPVEILPVRAVLASQSGFAVGMLIVLVAAAFLGKASVWWFLVPVLVFFQLLWLIGLAWILSVANLVFRDLQNIVGIAIMILMVLSPIAYTPEMLPSVLKPILWFNPFAYFILAYQKILMLGGPPSLVHMAAIAASSVLLFACGFFLFSRVKAIVTDYA